MSKITKFDRSTLREIRPSLEQALQTVAKEYGIQINIGSMRFSENQFTTRLTVNTTNQPSNTRMPASGPLKVGDKFKKKNTVYEVIGFNPNSPKYSVNVRTNNGAQWKIAPSFLVNAFKLN